MNQQVMNGEEKNSQAGGMMDRWEKKERQEFRRRKPRVRRKAGEDKWSTWI